MVVMNQFLLNARPFSNSSELLVKTLERHIKNCSVKICRSGRNQDQRGHRKIKCELNEGFVMISLYVKIDVHSSDVRALKMADTWSDRWSDRRICCMTTTDFRQNLAKP